MDHSQRHPSRAFTLALIAAFSLLLAFAGPVGAQQLAFKKKQQNEQTHFQYRWQDQNKQAQTLAFSIDNKVIFSRFRHFKAYQPKIVQRNLLMALQKAAAKLDAKKVRVEFINRSQGIEIIARGSEQQQITSVMAGLNALRDKIQSDYLSKNYYDTLTDSFGKTGVKPAHTRFAQESRADLQPLIKAILEHKPRLKGRQLTEFILAFVQSIPYSTLESRRESHGAGFSPPLRLLNNNQGDCDSKVTLMASILGSIYPRIKVAIIYLPEHALIGIQMGHRSSDKTLKLEGRNYLLAEPTGPAMIPLAEVAKSSAHFIDGQQFTYQVF